MATKNITTSSKTETTNVKTEYTLDNSTLKKAQEIKELMDSGKTLEEALQVILTKGTQPRRDNLEYITGLRNIPEVRRVRKIAYAKISKSKGKSDAVARYQSEIAAASDKLNDLLKEVYAAKEPWKKAMELGEDAQAAFNYFVQDYKDMVDKEMAKKAEAKKLTGAQVKSGILEQKPVIDTKVPELLVEAMKERIKNGDMMVITIARKVQFIKSMSK